MNTEPLGERLNETSKSSVLPLFWSKPKENLPPKPSNIPSQSSQNDSISVIKEENSKLEDSHRSNSQKRILGSKMASEKTIEKAPLDLALVFPKAWAKAEERVKSKSKLSGNQIESLIIMRMNLATSKIKLAKTQSDPHTMSLKHTETQKELSKYKFHEMSDPKYNRLYAKMMREDSAKRTSTTHIVPEIGDQKHQIPKISQSASKIGFREITEKVKKRGNSKHQVLNKLLNQKLKVKQKCFRPEKKNYKSRVQQISFQVEKIISGDPHRKYIIDEYNKSTFEKYLHYKRVKKIIALEAYTHFKQAKHGKKSSNLKQEDTSSRRTTKVKTKTQKQPKSHFNFKLLSVDRRFSRKAILKEITEKEIYSQIGEDESLQNYCKVVQGIPPNSQVKGIVKEFLKPAPKLSRLTMESMLAQNVMKSRNEVMTLSRNSSSVFNKNFNSFKKIPRPVKDLKKTHKERKRQYLVRQTHTKLTRTYHNILKEQAKMSQCRKFEDFMTKTTHNHNLNSEENKSIPIINQRGSRNSRSISKKSLKGSRRSSGFSMINFGSLANKRRSSRMSDGPKVVMRFV
ncbi:unnamed protein product [Moneuplotes crassus]|uniref:Uncharacterized protein n=1 Tax=Euplotes crassus TaxID=5936 RepID=A0AAD1XYN8_EUPCR|nr:unnamed protein product [Moneuplotes crassus]